MQFYAKSVLVLAISFALCVLRTESSKYGKPFQSDEGITETIVRMIGNHPAEYRKAFIKYAAIANEKVTNIDAYIPMPFQNTCDQCAVSVSIVFRKFSWLWANLPNLGKL